MAKSDDPNELSDEIRAHIDRRIRMIAFKLMPFAFLAGYGLFSLDLSAPAGGEYVDLSQPVKPPTVEMLGNTPVLKLYPDQNGHFLIDGSINGIRVPMVLDTGASGLSINRKLAREAGVMETARGYAHTANGEIPVSYGYVDALEIGPFRVLNVETSIRDVDAAGDVTLMGMSVLKHFDVTVTREYATLVKRRY